MWCGRDGVVFVPPLRPAGVASPEQGCSGARPATGQQLRCVGSVECPCMCVGGVCCPPSTAVLGGGRGTGECFSCYGGREG